MGSSDDKCASKQITIRDRSGLTMRFSGLIPLSEPECEKRIWTGSVILNSADLEYNQINYKLRAHLKKLKKGLNHKDLIVCNKSSGTIEQNEVFVLSFQVAENVLNYISLTLIVDSSPYDVPLYKEHKSDYYWIGKEIENVPNAEQALDKIDKEKTQNSCLSTSPKHISPGRIENIPAGLRQCLLEDDKGVQSIVRLIAPHARQLFWDLSHQSEPSLSVEKICSSNNSVDLIADEILRRFHEANRQEYPITPAT